MKLWKLFLKLHKKMVAADARRMLYFKTWTVEWGLWGAWRYTRYGKMKAGHLTNSYIRELDVQQARRVFREWAKAKKKPISFAVKFRDKFEDEVKDAQDFRTELDLIKNKSSVRAKKLRSVLRKMGARGGSQKTRDHTKGSCMTSVTFRGDRNGITPLIVWRTTEITRRLIADLWLIDCLMQVIFGEEKNIVQKVQLNFGILWFAEFHAKLAVNMMPELEQKMMSSVQFSRALRTTSSKLLMAQRVLQMMKEQPCPSMFHDGRLLKTASKPDFPLPAGILSEMLAKIQKEEHH